MDEDYFRERSAAFIGIERLVTCCLDLVDIALTRLMSRASDNPSNLPRLRIAARCSGPHCSTSRPERFSTYLESISTRPPLRLGWLARHYHPSPTTTPLCLAYHLSLTEATSLPIELLIFMFAGHSSLLKYVQ